MLVLRSVKKKWKCRFRLQNWNLYERTLNGEERTNNSVEAWHNSVQFLFNVNHPNIYRFIETLKKQQTVQYYEVAQTTAGKKARKSSKYKKVNERIQKIVNDYKIYSNMLDYLRSIAYNYTL